jgi:hypothetical protein
MLADRRELYNDQVYRYNTRISTWPTLALTPFFGWKPREFLRRAGRPAPRPTSGRPDMATAAPANLTQFVRHGEIGGRARPSHRRITSR